MKVDIIIPCYNEDKNVKKLVASWNEVINDNSNFYVYFVENGSSDNTKKNLVYEIVEDIHDVNSTFKNE